MIPPITPLSPAAITPIAEAAPAKAAVTGNVFGQVFAEAVNRVEQYRVNAETAVERFLSGEDQELHKVAMAAQQAELSFQLFLQVKNKAVQAYQDVMRMQL
jgi:flagellar hook-basal body complex protein FliE